MGVVPFRAWLLQCHLPRTPCCSRTRRHGVSVAACVLDVRWQPYPVRVPVHANRCSGRDTVIWCRVHRSTFKNASSRWCKASNPNDVCEVDKATLPPRMLPPVALLMLGSRADHPGWLEFLLQAKREGFGIDQPGDHDLTDEQWRDIAEIRVSVLVSAFDAVRNDRTKEPSDG